MKRLTCIGGTLTGVLFSFPIMAAELRVGLQDDPDVLDPHQSRTFVGRIVYEGLCDKLVDITPELEIVPQLATGWEWSDDASQLVMDLREGVVFHDGTSFDAQAVVANIERAMTLPESRRRSELASVDTIEATGDYQVTFTLTSPDASLLAQLTDRAGMMLSPEAFEEMGANFGSNPVCSGPMRFVERVQQDRIVLEKFEDYWNAENIFIDRVSYLPIPDATVRLANLRSGDINMLERLAASDATAVQNAANLAYEEVVGLGYQALYVNIDNGSRADNPMGNDNRLRQAFSLAIDRDAINQVVFEGTQSPGNQPFPPSSPWYNADIPVPERDVETARALLQEAGFERLEVELQVGNNPVQMQMMQVVQSMVAEAGFDVRLQATEYTTLLSEQTAGNFQLSRSDWSGRIDPDGNLHQFVTCEGGINDVRYCNPEVDALLDEARTFTEPSARKERYDAATQILQEDMPIIYLGHQSYIWAMDEAIDGFVPSPDGMIRLTGMRIAE